MHIWQKFVTPQWFARNEARLQNATRGRHAVIEHSNRKRVLVECSCSRIGDARRLARDFGGLFHPLPADWFERFSRQQNKALKIGKRLVITNVGGTSASRQRLSDLESRHRGRSHIVIPAEMAFGTGDHATTAMSLRLLEEITREMKAGWSLVDLGTGSGILALAAKCFGADAILAIDNDAQAIRIAKQNAHRNKIRGVKFEVRDVLGPKDRHKKFDLITANLFSELLIEALPIWKARLKRNGRMFLSGILREQLPQLRSALRRERLSILRIRRRGKWVALLVE